MSVRANSTVPPHSLGRMTAVGMTWILLQSAGGRVVGFMAQLVTAALLTPADFGLIGLTYTVSAVGGLLVSFGIESVLLQRNRGLRLWEGAALWCTFGLGLIGLLLVLLISPIAAQIYHAPRLPLLAAIIAISSPITSLQTVPLVLLRARFAFRQLALINFVEILGIQGLTVALALDGFGAMSFPIPLLVTAIIKTIALWFIAPPDLRGGLKRIRRFRYLFANSATVFGTGMIQAMIAQGDYVILGLFSTPTVVGAYFFAFKMASQPVLLMATSLTGVLLPALSKLKQSPREQAAAAIRAARIVSFIVMPATFLQAGLTAPVVHLFFVSKWDASIPLMQILSIGLGLDAITWVAAALLTARAGFRLQLVYMMLCAPVFFGFVGAGAWLGSGLGVSVAVALYYFCTSPVLTWAVFKRDGLSIPKVAGIYLLPIILSVVAIGTSLLLADRIGLGNTAQIIFVSGLSTVFYVVLLRVADRPGLDDIRNLIASLIRR